MNKKEYKSQKKAFRKAKHKAIRPWKGLSILFAILAVISIAGYTFVSVFDNTIAAFAGGTFWTLENKDENAQYFKSDFATAEEMTDYGLLLCEQVEAEGATLLLNRDNALPLDKGAAVSCFSNSSVNLVYGGTGSGNIDASTADTLKSALEKADFKVNETLWDFYKTGEGSKYATSRGGVVTTTSATTSEVPWEVYTDEAKNSVAKYGDAAIVVLSRVGGEGADLSYQDVNYLALDENEKDMLANVKKMKDAGDVKKIVVLINSANTLQLDFLKDNTYDIDACLWIGDVGITGINAVANILNGDVTPSGSLVDTYLYDNYSSPAMANFSPLTYEGFEEAGVDKKASTYMIYQEGIYVGYKYYETRYEDMVMGKGNAGAYQYADAVAYPFGFGLSYTDFAYSDMEVSYDKAADKYTVKVKVTNVGTEFSGKETVQIYAQTPYTEYDIANKIEKASVALCGFGKTDILAPGASEVVTITVDRRDLASYDAYGKGTYILDAGDYFFTAATDAHNAVNNILTAKGFTTDNGMDAEGKKELVYAWNEAEFDATSYATSANGTKIENQLSDADPNLYEGTDSKITFLSRNDWTGTFPTGKDTIALSDKLVKDLALVRYQAEDYDAAEMPTLGAKNGVTLYDMIGLSYDDPKWDSLLDQMTYAEMVRLIGDSFHWTMPCPSINAPGSRDENGPQGLTASLLGSNKTQLKSTAFTSEDVMAATFNTDLMYEIGRVIGNNCVAADIAILYGPGNNIHRTPYGGRNFEYYSEDGFLSGAMSAPEVKAIQEKGVHVVMKHFALNDCEQERIGLGVWLNEQAGRELYLNAFQAPIEEGNGNGVMVAYTRWGAVWSGGNKGLITNILRDEWGCDGLIITDNVLTQYVNGPDGVMAGVSTFDAMLPFVKNALPKYKNDPVMVSAMREACHHNLYAIANSVAMNGMGPDTIVKTTRPTIIRVLNVCAFVFPVLFVVALFFFIKRKKAFKQTNAYVAFKNAKKMYKNKQ